MKKGFALLLSLIVTSILLVVGIGVSNIAFREIYLSSIGNQSEIAFYAAETGLECGLYWDKVDPWKGGVSAATSTFVNQNNPGSGGVISGNVDCVGVSNSFAPFPVGSSNNVKFNINNPCVVVEVNKDFGGNPEDDINAITIITSTGYNTCNDLDPRRVGRTLELELKIP
jgi:hypothetical protein